MLPPTDVPELIQPKRFGEDWRPLGESNPCYWDENPVS